MENSKVIFAGYKVPHPLEHDFILKIQTTADTSPIAVLQEEINSLLVELASSLSVNVDILRNFQDELTLRNMEAL